MWQQRGNNKRVRNAIRTNGFSSKLENAVHEMLLLREKAGEIEDIKCQQAVELFSGPREKRLTWRLDFSFKKKGVLWYAEAKGYPTEVYLLKLKIWRNLMPAPLEIWKGSYSRPVRVEVLE